MRMVALQEQEAGLPRFLQLPPYQEYERDPKDLHPPLSLSCRLLRESNWLRLGPSLFLGTDKLWQEIKMICHIAKTQLSLGNRAFPVRRKINCCYESGSYSSWYLLQKPLFQRLLESCHSFLVWSGWRRPIWYAPPPLDSSIFMLM